MHHSDPTRHAIDVRLAQASDAAAIALLATESFAPNAALTGGAAPSVEDVKAFLARAEAGACIATASGENVGTVSYVVEGDVFHLFRLAVDARWRRRGVATALVTAIETIARERGAVVVYLQTPRELGLIEWYQRLGYRLDREETEVVRGVAVAMADMTKVL